MIHSQHMPLYRSFSSDDQPTWPINGTRDRLVRVLVCITKGALFASIVLAILYLTQS